MTCKPVVRFHYLYDFLEEVPEGGSPEMWTLIREELKNLEERYQFRAKWKLSQVIDRMLVKGGADIVLIDYGALSTCNSGSWTDHYTRTLYRAAADHPGTIYIIASTMTRWAVDDALANIDPMDNLRYLGDDFEALDRAVKDILGIK